MSGKEPAEAEHTAGKKRGLDELLPSPEELFGAALQAKFPKITLTAWIALLKRMGNTEVRSSGNITANIASIVSASPIDVTLSTLANASTNDKMNQKELAVLAQELWTQYKDSHGYSKHSMPVSFPTKNDPKDKLLEMISELQGMHGKLAPGVDVSQLSMRAKPTPTPVTPGPGASNAQQKEEKTAKTAELLPQRRAHLTVEDVVGNQGGFGVCGAYAMAFYLGRHLLWMHNFAIDAENFAEKIKILMPCWNGARLDHMIEAWNNLGPDQACVENLNQDKRIHFKLSHTEYKCFSTAHKQLLRLHEINLPLLISMKIGAAQTNHAVVGVLPYWWRPREGVKYPRIGGVNSWGSHDPLTQIDYDKFNFAFDCTLVNVKVLDGKGNTVVGLRRPLHVTEWLANKDPEAKAQAAVASAASAPGPSSPTTYSGAVVAVLKKKNHIKDLQNDTLLREKEILEQEVRIANAASARLAEQRIDLAEQHVERLQVELRKLQDAVKAAEQDEVNAVGELKRMMSALSEADKAALLQLDM